MKEIPSFTYYLSVIFKHRHYIGKVVLLFIISAVIISLLIPNQYTATTTILPPSSSFDGLFSIMGADVFSSFQGAAGLSGILPEATSPSDLFAVILESGTITGKLIQKYDLKKVFKVKTVTDATENLKEITQIMVSPEGIISISITWYDRQLAADIANSYMEELDRFNTETAMTAGKKYRIFIEQRLKETEDNLAKAEITLRDFQEEHRTVVLDTEIESAIATVAKLKSEIIMLEVQKGAASSSGSFNNPYVIKIDQELRELKKQLAIIQFGSTDTTKKEFGAGFSVPFSELPEKSLEYVRLVREVKIQEAIYEILIQQYEQAKMMELKDTPTVQLLDRASPPEEKSIPKRGRIVIISAFWGFVFGVFASFFSEWLEKIKKNPKEYTKITALWTEIKEEFHNFKSKILAILKFKKSQTK
ncbi:MAG: GNVR domain-containing protein [bacterium]